MGEVTEEYKILDRRPLKIPRLRWEDNIRIYLR
jgi:hypothetical protein